ncbi:MAG: hypothetical protein ACLFUC_08080 [Bacteroidales bacterium]
MTVNYKEKTELARNLMDDFAVRTGLSNADGDARRRYLWTDAFAVQSFFGLGHITHSDAYREWAMRLIHEVHHQLGKHRHDDPRQGWISGLSDEEGRKSPTIGGLRIGKDLPERGKGETYNDKVEWERDGQYFHYITRWINTLLHAAIETSEHQYAKWAADLTKAGEKFIDNSDNRTRMYWKMSIDLSHPIVESMGAHDPLEGLICVLSMIDSMPERHAELINFRNNLESLCDILDWFTTDALGIGGLLLNTVRVAELNMKKVKLHDSIIPRKLWKDCMDSLHSFTGHVHAPNAPAEVRLAFRECGLSLGIRTMAGLKYRYQKLHVDFDEIDKFLPLAEAIEDFWCEPANREVKTWTRHRDINEVMFASSLIAEKYPFPFAAVPFKG